MLELTRNYMEGLVMRLTSLFKTFGNIYKKKFNIDALPSPGVNPLEGSPMWSCGIETRKGAPDFQHYKGVEGRARSPGIRLGRRTSRSSLILHSKQTTKWLVYIQEHPWVLGQATGTLDHKTHHGPDSGEATTFSHIVFFAPHFGDYIQTALFPGTPKLESRNCPEIVPKLSRMESRDFERS
jgi:hypothetical protein